MSTIVKWQLLKLHDRYVGYMTVTHMDMDMEAPGLKFQLKL
jgi:hypothetical protein